MMGNFVLYPKVERKALSFKGVKEVVLPDQSMGLREIIKRFIRKESLPVQKEGFYEERFGDLEKLSNEDMIVQLDRAKEIGEWLAKAKAKMDKIEKEKADAIQAASAKEAERKAKLDALLDKSLTDPVK